MSGARRRAFLLPAAALMLAGALGFAAARRSPAPIAARPATERPTLLLLTSLPLVFSDDFSLHGGGSEALKKLRTRYRVIPISVTDGVDLAKGRLLLMAQPQAQTSENLVTLDNWVRGGGAALLLADPTLEWPSKRPLGDPLRPPPMFADTGLLGHWGLRLDAPDEPRAERRQLGGFQVVAISPGLLSGSCQVSGDGFVGDCPIAKGRVIVVADADFIGTQGLGQDGAHNLDGLLGELAKLESK
jgi:hypothetical protein